MQKLPVGIMAWVHSVEFSLSVLETQQWSVLPAMKLDGRFVLIIVAFTDLSGRFLMESGPVLREQLTVSMSLSFQDRVYVPLLYTLSDRPSSMP